MGAVLGIAIAACFGTADFLGGFAAKRSATIAVLARSQVVALVLAAGFALVSWGDPTGRDLVFGALSGVFTAAALGLLYQGLATGRMSVVAPVTAVVGSVLPVAWGLARGERPSAVALVGVAAATAAGGLIAREPDTHGVATISRLRALALAVTAGSAFAAGFVFFAETGPDAGLSPVLTARLAAVPLVLAVAVALGRTRVVVHADRRLAVGAGVLDVTGSALILVALRTGLVTLVAPLAALAPAFTVLWAAAVLQERIARWQVAGLTLGAAGLVLIAAG